MRLNKRQREELSRLAKAKGGIVRPADVVQFARSPKTALHKAFEWNNTRAAEAWRLQQARMILTVRVEIIKGSNESFRAFVSLRDDRHDSGGYRLTADVLSDHDLREKMLAEALEELGWFESKYQHLKELASVFRAAKKIRANHSAKRKRRHGAVA